MNVTRDVVRDLLPAYFGGEATEDTRRLVEEFFRSDPDFERQAREQGAEMQLVGSVAQPSADAAQETSALARVHRILKRKRRLFGIALALTINSVLVGLSFQITTDAGGHITSIHWIQFAFQKYLVMSLATAAAIAWLLYFITERAPGRKG